MSVRFATRDDFDDVALISAHPEVFPTYGFHGAVEPKHVHAIVKRRFDEFTSVMLEDGSGYFMFERMDPRNDAAFFVHVACMRRSRGKVLLDAARETIQLVRGVGVQDLWAWVDKHRHDVAVFASLCGFEPADIDPRFQPERHPPHRGSWMRMILAKEDAWAVVQH